MLSQVKVIQKGIYLSESLMTIHETDYTPSSNDTNDEHQVMHTSLKSSDLFVCSFLVQIYLIDA